MTEHKPAPVPQYGRQLFRQKKCVVCGEFFTVSGNEVNAKRCQIHRKKKYAMDWLAGRQGWF